MEPTLLTWIILVVGNIFIGLLLAVQLLMIFKPKSQKTRDIIIGTDKDWHDLTHYKTACGFAWADWLIIMPLLIASDVAIIAGSVWGYILWIALGILFIYFSILFFVFEKEYTYPSAGPLAYYTYYWGVYIYWGIVVLIYSIIKLKGVL